MRKLSLLFFALFGVAIYSVKADNCEFEEKYKAINFQATADGEGNVNLKLLSFAYGGYNHWAGDGSNLSYSPKGSTATTTIIQYHTDNNKDGHHPKYQKGWIRFRVLEGSFAYTDMNGQRIVISDTDWHDLWFAEDGDSDRHRVFLQGTWYPATTLISDFDLHLYVKDERVNYHWDRNYNLGSFSPKVPGGGDKTILRTPELQAAFFSGEMGDGVAKAGIAYVSYHAIKDAKIYDGNTLLSDFGSLPQSGIFYLPFKDIEQYDIHANMTLYRDSAKQTAEMNSTSIRIAPYHSIQNFKVTEYSKTYTQWGHVSNPGWNQLTWEILNPKEGDILQTDYFEIQRAWKPDFSDAETLAAVPMTRVNPDGDAPDDKQIYTYVDSTMEATYNPYQPQNGKVYYRVRRASSYMWGWEGHRYAQCDSIQKKIVLPAVGGLTLIYNQRSKDHKVVLSVNLNDVVEEQDTTMLYAWDPNFKLIFTRHERETGNSYDYVITRDSVVRDRYNTGSSSSRAGHISINDYPVNSCVHVYYTLRVDTAECVWKLHPKAQKTQWQFELPADSFYHSDPIPVEKLTATRDSVDYTLVTWTSQGNVDCYVIESKRENESEYHVMDTLHEEFYLDTISPIGENIHYRVSSHYNCKGNNLVHSASVVGNTAGWGTISGKVVNSDGTGIAGIKVTATEQSVENPRIYTAVTNNAGIFCMDTVRFAVEVGSVYSVVPTSEDLIFTYNGSKEAVATTSLSAHHAKDKSGIVFENSSSFRFEGRVRYRNSTVPVKGVNFYINGEPVCTADGKMIESDVNGDFALVVPHYRVSIQARKKAHTFANDGWFTLNDSTHFILNKNEYGLVMFDETKVVMTGRIAGGTNEGNKAMFDGSAKNNLGDNLQMVLELEGDNISQLVHVDTDLQLDTVDAVFTHPNMSNLTTQMHMTRKRITIQPDPATGEYVVELFPVRYKVVQLTATGYSTLLPAGEALPTIDLTMAPETTDTLHLTDTTFVYNYLYKHIYRSPATITYQQKSNTNSILPYFGSESMPVTSFGDDTNVSLWTNTNGYLFGKPVFDQGKYTFVVSAHEDYYYNNIPTGYHTQVMLQGDVIIHNGLNSSTEIIHLNLGKNGQNEVKLNANNTTFSLQEEKALRNLTMSMVVNGATVESETLEAFVIGARNRGTTYENAANTQSGKRDEFCRNIILMDILRDPYGEGSYSYLEKGMQYSAKMNWGIKFGLGPEFEFKFGESKSFVMGTYAGSPAAGNYIGQNVTIDNTTQRPLSIMVNWAASGNTTYTFTTNDRIQTSSDPYMQGSVADVYIGTEMVHYLQLKDNIAVVGEKTYKQMLPSFDEGTSKLLATSVNPKGEKYYLVIGSSITSGLDCSASFAYSQQHIYQTIIPDLLARRNDLLIMNMDSASAQNYANKHQKSVYVSKVDVSDSRFGTKGQYSWYAPKTDTVSYDEVACYNSLILQWTEAIQFNEKEKGSTIEKGKNKTIYNLDGSIQRSYSESSNGNAYTYIGSPTISVGGSASKKNDPTTIGSRIPVGNNQLQQAIQSLLSNEIPADTNTSVMRIEVGASTMTWSWKINYNFDYDYNFALDSTFMRTIGYVLDAGQGNYLSQAVYRIADSTLNESQALINAKNGWYDFFGRSNGNIRVRPVNFVFAGLGGATRCPYLPSDSALFTYTINNQTKNYGFSAPTLHIENPKITIDKRDISNVPADDAAIFTLTLTNDSEVKDGTVPIPNKFVIGQVAGSNAHGAVLDIDGQSLNDMGEIIINPGQSISKTMTVRRGDGYDFSDLRIRLRSSCDITTYDEVEFAVHFVPNSSPVTLTMPTDKWVLNTLAPHDSIGYYLPIEISGYDVNYRQFDHIELQYKLTNEPEEAWVNLCSYYADDALYQAATGNKGRIESGKISNIRFYGERDPMEQKYDLRAVSFCRYGNGFITQSSPVRSGIKDTRPPKVFTIPRPTNNILTFEDNIVVTFSEDIAGNYLDEDNNFQVLGITRSLGITTGTSLAFSGKENAYAKSTTKRNLNAQSFAIDLVVLPANPNQEGTFFATQAGNTLITFGQDSESHLVANIGGHIYQSETITPIEDFRRVVMTYNHLDNTIHFYSGTEDKTSQTMSKLTIQGLSSGYFYFGGMEDLRIKPFAGRILEARVWTKYLTPDDLTLTHMKRLSGYEHNLLAYYPMNEGKGTILKDEAHGANLQMHNLDWQNPAGMAPHLSTDFNNGKGIELDENFISRSAKQDMSLLFYWKADPNAPDSMQLFAANDLHIVLKNGVILLEQNNSQIKVSVPHDNQWHQFALTVARALHTARIYIDGALLQEFSSDYIQSVTRPISLGAGFAGYIDEFTMWEQALPETFIQQFSNYAPLGSEMGLMCYLPFHEQILSNQGQWEMRYSPYSKKKYYDSNHNEISRKDEVVLTDISSQTQKDIYAPVQTRGELSKLAFSWMNRQNELVVSLDVADSEINKSQVFLTVRDVEDLCGNTLVSPLSWTIYVDRNRLRWAQKELNVILPYGKDTTIALTIQNDCGLDANYSLTKTEKWISLTPEYGVLPSEGEQKIQLHISPELDPGEYTTIIYLTDQNNLSEPLLINFTVMANEPNWEVKNHKISTVMNIIGKVVIEKEQETGTLMTIDTALGDIVAAFINGECVGKTSPKDKDGLIYMTVYGTSEDHDKRISFRLWRHNSGRIYTLVPSRKITFTESSCAGCDGNLVVLTASASALVQPIMLNNGWNWISTYLQLPQGENINRSFLSTDIFAAADEIKSPMQNQYANYVPESSSFEGPLKTLSHKNTYMIYSENGGQIYLQGSVLPDSLNQFYLRHGWNSMPYTCANTQSLSEAMADYYNNAKKGDIIKSYTQFAIFTEDGHWTGSLEYMRPGQGYYLFRHDNTTCKFSYVNGKSVMNSELDMIVKRIASSNGNNMPIVASYQGELFFLLVYGEEGQSVDIEMEIDGIKRIADEHPIFNSAGSMGTCEQPLELHFSNNEQETNKLNTSIYKMIDNNQIVIVHDGKKTNMLGIQLK